MIRPICVALLVVVLCGGLEPMLAPAGAAEDSELVQFKKLLGEIEQYTRYSAQADTWQDARDAWSTKLREAATLSDIKPLLLEYETSVTWNAMNESWRGRRDAWSAEVRAAADVATLADRLKQLEDSIKWESHTEEWQGRRDAWIQAASALVEAEGPEPAPEEETGGEPPAATDFGRLLAQLERNVRYSAQSDRWDEEREAWGEQVLQATRPADLAALLLKFEKSLRWSASDDAWRQLREPWMEHVRNARSLAELAKLLAAFEQEINWQAQEDGWRQAREAWLAAVNTAARAAGAASPGPAATGSTAAAPTTPGPATTQTTTPAPERPEDTTPVDETIDPGRIEITEPADGLTTTNTVIRVSGTVENRAVSVVSLDVNGSPRTVPVTNGAFSSEVPLVTGDNVVQARYGETTSNSVTIDAKIVVAAIWTELTWDSVGDIDLHLYLPNGEHCYYDAVRTPSGAVLDVDNREAYGPEHITIENAVAGDYRIAVVYFRGSGNPVGYRVTLRLGAAEPRTFTGRLTKIDEEQVVTTFTLGESEEGSGELLGGVPSREFTNWEPARIHEVSPNHEAAGDAVDVGKYYVYIARKIANKEWPYWRWLRYGPFDLQSRMRYNITQDGKLRERTRDADEGSASFWFCNGDSRDWYAFYVHAITDFEYRDWQSGRIQEVSPSHEAAGDAVSVGKYHVFIARKVPNRDWTKWRWQRYGPFELQSRIRYNVTQDGQVRERARDADEGSASFWFCNGDTRDWYAFYVHRVPGPGARIDINSVNLLRELSRGQESAGEDILDAGSYLVYIAVRIPNKPYDEMNWVKHGPFALRGGKRYVVTNGGAVNLAAGTCGPNETALGFQNGDPQNAIIFAVKRVGPGR